jgi:hypothetical protein
MKMKMADDLVVARPLSRRYRSYHRPRNAAKLRASLILSNSPRHFLCGGGNMLVYLKIKSRSPARKNVKPLAIKTPAYLEMQPRGRRVPKRKLRFRRLPVELRETTTRLVIFPVEHLLGKR